VFNLKGYGKLSKGFRWDDTSLEIEFSLMHTVALKLTAHLDSTRFERLVFTVVCREDTWLKKKVWYLCGIVCLL